MEVFLDPAGKRESHYQFIVNANGALFDSAGRADSGGDAPGVVAASHTGSDCWSVEIYVPYDSFPEHLRPGTGVEWYGNLTRHRVTDRSQREYTALNVTSNGATSHNQNAFVALRFVER